MDTIRYDLKAWKLKVKRKAFENKSYNTVPTLTEKQLIFK